MKSLLFTVAILILSLNTAIAEKAFDEAPVTIKMESYISRELILLILKNNSLTSQTITITPGEFMNTPNAQALRVAIAPGEEKTQSLKLGSIEGVKLPLIIDYKIHYVKDRSSRIAIHNPMQFFMKNREGEFQQTDARSMQAFLEPTLERDERAEPTTIDLGAGAKVESTLENLAFPVYAATPEEEQTPVEVVRAVLPKFLSEQMRINNLPGDITIPSRAPVVPAPRENQVNTLEQTFMEKGGGCDPLGLFNCYHGQLKVVNLKRKGNPASWGWTVELWATKVIFGAKISYMIGNTETDGSGNWVVKVPSKDAPLFAKVIFKPINRFINVVNPSTLKTYQYQDSVLREQAKVSLFNGSSQGGIGRIFNYANQLWVRLANGKINPISGFGPYTVAYPNALSINGNVSPCTTKNSEGSLIAWSCALGSPTGAIYLIPEHDDLETVVHELGHKIHKAHWGKFPAGSGGSHSLWKCYTKGLAIVEGFANFLATWLQSKSYNDTAGYFAGVNVETFSNGACFTAQNELAVVGMFWDLYDTQQETVLGPAQSDVITYYSDTNLIADFLGNGSVLSGAPDFMKYLVAKHPEATYENFYGLFMLNVVAF